MKLNRRDALAATVAGTVAGIVSGAGVMTGSAQAEVKENKSTIRFCLNTSTIREKKLPIEQIVELAGAVGYDGIEPWIRELEAYKESGKSLPDLKKKLADSGLRVESAIGFARWVVNDDAERAKGVEQMKRDMDLVEAIGGTHIAAPPVGMHGKDSPDLDLFAAAERYHTILDVGRETGVTPQVEIWGPAKNLSRLGEAVFVAVESGHPDACVLPDVYHIFRGGSSFDGLGLLNGNAVHCFHFNDYPATPARLEMNDSNRVYPGDGVAPWKQILGLLSSIGFSGAVSLELFNKEYWKQDPEMVMKTGLSKMKSVFANQNL
ncbi:sugar phosphate isomerase/epimerase family protein [Thalassoglobus polymorphus]|uniref:Inosose isomerase n=1 Tax=Thalassoglobus polymorphus TaxID=2527994 RepID=A0A517QN68_9PLAN|nr:sugar phosphate isomerase/epimerase family protein [Thalassoglobus polymorphus]QDT33082.1 Inosose isomerase [Thalassoglobus polymorphus]